VDCANLRTAMGRRLRKEPQVDVKEWAIPCGWFFPPENLAKLDKPGTVETGFMENDRLKRFFGDMGQIWNEANPVERLELTLKRAQMIYLRRFAKIYPATQAALLEYFFRKRLEVDAMRLIARAQETRREAEIEKLLIVWA